MRALQDGGQRNLSGPVGREADDDDLIRRARKNLAVETYAIHLVGRVRDGQFEVQFAAVLRWSVRLRVKRHQQVAESLIGRLPEWPAHKVGVHEARAPCQSPANTRFRISEAPPAPPGSRSRAAHRPRVSPRSTGAVPVRRLRRPWRPACRSRSAAPPATPLRGGRTRAIRPRTTHRRRPPNRWRMRRHTRRFRRKPASA